MKNNRSVIFTLLLLISGTLMGASACNMAGGGSGEVKTINADSFEGKMKELKTYQLIDVRTPEEYAEGHLAGSVNLSANDASFEQAIEKLDKNTPVLVYCLSGGRSASAAKTMQGKGFKTIFNMEGGIMAWRKAHKPLEATTAASADGGMSKAAFDEYIKQHKTVLVDFNATWCGPCQKMKPYVEEIEKDKAESLSVLKIDADENAKLCEEMGVTGLPTLMVYKDGKQTFSQLGFMTKEDLLKAIEK